MTREASTGRRRSTFGYIAFLAVTLSFGCGDPVAPGPVITIQGVVYDDATSLPVPGVTVSILTNCKLDSRCDLVATVTDGVGAYHVQDLTKARCGTQFYFIYASAKGFAEAHASYECTASVQRIDLRLKSP
jgi:hypothetical protein